jgi:RNA polymerase sigma-70 factor (ECF subfamily)
VGAELADLESLYRSRFRAFAALAAAVAGDSTEAFDIVQDSFVTAVRKRRRFRGDAPLEAWVWRIVLNRARDRRREHSRRTRLESGGPVASENGHRADADVRLLLTRLPRRQRETVFLRYYAGLDYESIAHVLGISSGSVGATLHAAHAALRGMVEVADE